MVVSEATRSDSAQRRPISVDAPRHRPPGRPGSAQTSAEPVRWSSAKQRDAARRSDVPFPSTPHAIARRGVPAVTARRGIPARPSQARSQFDGRQRSNAQRLGAATSHFRRRPTPPPAGASRPSPPAGVSRLGPDKRGASSMVVSEATRSDVPFPSTPHAIARRGVPAAITRRGVPAVTARRGVPARPSQARSQLDGRQRSNAQRLGAEAHHSHRRPTPSPAGASRPARPARHNR